MEVLAAATGHLIAAKSSLIRCGIELQKLAFPMEHGLQLMIMVQRLDKIQQYMQSDRGTADASSSVHAKPKKRSRLRKKQDQSTPAASPPAVPNGDGSAAGAGSTASILRQFGTR